MVELRVHEVFLVAFAVRAIATGQVTVKPEDVELPLRLTVPLKLKILVRVTPTETPLCPTLRSLPEAVIVKSPT